MKIWPNKKPTIDNFPIKTYFEIFPIKTSGRTNFSVLLSTFGSRNCLHRALMKQNKRFQEKMKLKVIFQRSLSDDLSTSWKLWSLNIIILTSSELWKYRLSGKKRLSFMEPDLPMEPLMPSQGKTYIAQNVFLCSKWNL